MYEIHPTMPRKFNYIGFWSNRGGFVISEWNKWIRRRNLQVNFDEKFFKQLLMISVAQFIVFREKRKMAWREILREKLGHEKLTKKLQGKRPKMTQN